jgi:Mn2+/Fe2+ NRAMP family transporter
MRNPTENASAAPVAPAMEPWPEGREGWFGRVPILRSFGPGVVFTLTVIGASDFITNSAAGATRGYALLWLLPLSLLFRYIWLSASAKYVLHTGESLIQGYVRVGQWLGWILLVSLVVLKHVFQLYRFVLMGECLTAVLPLPTPFSSAIYAFVSVAAAFILIFWGGYSNVERVLRWFILAMGSCLALAGVFSHPHAAGIVRGFLIPTLGGEQRGYGTFLLLAGLVGSTAGSVTNISYSYFLQEKGWRGMSYLRRQRVDLLLTIGAMLFMGAVLQIVAAGALHGKGLVPRTVNDLLTIYSSTFGEVGRVLIAMGLWSAGFCSTVSNTTGSGIIVTDICRNVLPPLRRMFGPASAGKPTNTDPIFRVLVVVWMVSPLYVLFTDWKPVALSLAGHAVAMILMPLLAYGLFRITSDRKLMGDHRNHWLTNAGLLVIAAVAFGLASANVWGWLRAF